MKLRLLKILLLSLAAYASMTTLGSELPDESSQGSSAGSDAAEGPSVAAAGPSEEAGETKAATHPIDRLPPGLDIKQQLPWRTERSSARRRC